MGGRENFQTIGAVVRADTCISITWPWLAFPGVLNFLTVVLMVLIFRKQVVSSRWWGDPLTQHSYN